MEFEKECPENEGAGLLWRIKHYTSSDDLAKEYLELLGDATAEASGGSNTAGGGAEGARRSFLDLAIEATKIEKTLLYWIVYYGNLEIVQSICNTSLSNKMIIFASFFEYTTAPDSDIIHFLRDQCSFTWTTKDREKKWSAARAKVAARISKEWETSKSKEGELPLWLQQINFHPNPKDHSTYDRPGSVNGQEIVFTGKTGLAIQAKWNNVSSSRFPQLKVNPEKMLTQFSTGGRQDFKIFRDGQPSGLLEILKKTCRFQVNQVMFDKNIDNMNKRARIIDEKEEALKTGQPGQSGGGRKQFFMQTGGALSKAEEILQAADFAAVAREEEEEAELRSEELEEEKFYAEAEKEIMDIMREEAVKIMHVNMIKENTKRMGETVKGWERVQREEVEHIEEEIREAEEKEEAAEDVAEAHEAHINTKLDALDHLGDGGAVFQKFAMIVKNACEVLKERANVKFYEEREDQIKEKAASMDRRSSLRYSSLLGDAAARPHFDAMLEELRKAWTRLEDAIEEITKNSELGPLLELRVKPKSKEKVPFGNKFLWSVIDENEKLINTIEINYNFMTKAGEANARWQPPAVGGRRTRRKKKKRKKRTRRK